MRKQGNGAAMNGFIPILTGRLSIIIVWTALTCKLITAPQAVLKKLDVIIEVIYDQFWITSIPTTFTSISTTFTSIPTTFTSIPTTFTTKPCIITAAMPSHFQCEWFVEDARSWTAFAYRWSSLISLAYAVTTWQLKGRRWRPQSNVFSLILQELSVLNHLKYLVPYLIWLQLIGEVR